MAHEQYNLQWKRAMERLSRCIAEENVKDPEAPEEAEEPKDGEPEEINIKSLETSKKNAFQHFSRIYIQYLQTYQELEEC